MLVTINVAMLLLLAVFLYMLKRKNVKFSVRVMIALVLGISLGIGLQWTFGADSQEITNSMPWYNIIGNGYIKLLQMIAMPFIFISILMAFTKMTIGKKFGKIAFFILAMLIGTTAISAIVGIGTTTLFNLEADQIIQGEAELARGEALVERAETCKM